MLRNLPIIIFLFFFGSVYSQTTITTNHTNNNGNGSVTFNVYNSNTYDIVVTDLQCHLGTTANNYCQVLVNHTPVNDNAPPWSLGTIGDGQNGWTLQGSATVSSNTANGIVTALSDLEIIIPAGATYGFGFSATTLQYQSLGSGVNTFTQEGVSILTGDGISWGGTAYPATPGNYPRGLIGGITFMPATPCVSPPTAGTISSDKNCISGDVKMWIPSSGLYATYQWQSSATGKNYTSISGAESRIYNANVSSDTYFRCYVTCGGASDTTEGFLIKTPKTGYITPVLCHGEELDIDGTVYTTTGTYTQVLTAANGCDSTLTIDLTILNEKTGHITPVICSNEELNIDGTVYNTAGTFTQVLKAANGCDSTLTIDLTVLDAKTKLITSALCYGEELDINGTIYNIAGSYTQVLTAANGCDSTITIDLTIAAQQDVTVSVSGATLTANVYGASYQWLDADDDFAIIEGETNQSFTATANGHYAVAITENSCTDTSEVQSIILTDIQLSHKNGMSLTVAPNPTNGFVTIGITGTEFKAALSEGVQLTLLNALNKPLYTTTLHSDQHRIDMEGYESGIYFLQLKTRTNAASTKIVKQ